MNKTIYFCQGCSAVLYHRVKFCPHCGDKQYYEYTCGNCGTEVTEFDDDCPECGSTVYSDEYKPRGCSWCGNNLDIDGRNLDLKYCNGVDCGKEIGGLIRYSDETGEELSVDEINKKNDYRNELKDWLASVYNDIYNTYFPCFNRLLFIYDKTNAYTGKDFVEEFGKFFDKQFIHHITDFDFITDNTNLNILLKKEKHLPNKKQHCLCVIDIHAYDEETEAHTIIHEYVGDYMPGDESDYFDIVRKLNVSFIFVSSNLPEKTKIYSMYDKHILIVTPEKLRSIDVGKLWKRIKEEHNGT